MKSVETGGLLAGRYEIEGCIGSGGMGKVYRALQGKFKRPVAVKIINLNNMTPEMRERFEREMKILMIDPPIPNVVHIEDYGEFDGYDFFVMQLLTGGTLRQRMELREQEGRPLPSAAEVNLLVQKLATALHAVHKLNIIHRDIKPSNIMFDSAGNPYIIDFGIARDVSEQSDEQHNENKNPLTQPGLGVGTLQYMSLAQRTGKQPTPAFDLYALAVMIYQVLNGYFPYQSQNAQYSDQLGMDIENQAPLERWRADLPVQLRRVFEKAIWQRPGDSYANLEEFAKDFQKASQASEADDTGFFNVPVASPEIDYNDLPSTLHKAAPRGTDAVTQRMDRVTKNRWLPWLLAVLVGGLLIANLPTTDFPRAASPSVNEVAANPTTAVRTGIASPTLTPATTSTPLPTATLTPTPTACDVLLNGGLTSIDQWVASGCAAIYARIDPNLGEMVLVPCLRGVVNCVPLWVNRYEITQGQYSGVSGQASWLPATELSALRAREWCRDRGGGDLLTVQDYERASGAAYGLPYAWGQNPHSHYPLVGEPYAVNGYLQDVSWAGVYNLGGNVAEFVQGEQVMGSHFNIRTAANRYRIDSPPRRLSDPNPTTGFRCKVPAPLP